MSGMIEYSKKVLIGHVSVDSGQVMMIDPCYLEDWKHGDYFPGKKESENSYDEACKATTSENNGGSVFNELAVVTATAYGDGTYPVYQLFINNNFVGIIIDFDGIFEEDENEEDEDF